MAFPSSNPVRPEGFPGQQIAVLPARAIDRLAAHPVIAGLLPSAAGFFPRAAGHLVLRERGIDEAIVMLCTEGRGWVEIDQRRHAVESNQTAWIPTGLAHRYGADADQPWTLAWVHLRGNQVDELSQWLGFDHANCVGPSPNCGDLIPLVDRIGHRLRPPYHETDLLLAATLTRQLLIQLKRLCDAPRDHHPDLAERVRATADWMRERLDRPIRLAELAGRAQLSASRYNEVFKQIYNCTPMAFCTAQRIRSACDLFTTTPLKVHEVARRVGFDDPLYFSRVFKKVMGTSPRDYQRFIRGGST